MACWINQQTLLQFHPFLSANSRADFPCREITGRHAGYWQLLIDSGHTVVFGPVLDGTGSWGLAVVEFDDGDDRRSVRLYRSGSCRDHANWHGRDREDACGVRPRILSGLNGSGFLQSPYPGRQDAPSRGSPSRNLWAARSSGLKTERGTVPLERSLVRSYSVVDPRTCRVSEAFRVGETQLEPTHHGQDLPGPGPSWDLTR